MDTIAEIHTESSGDFLHATSSRPNQEPRLQDLIPIAAVIVGGCETCAEKTVGRAIKEGASFEDIQKTLRILAGLQKMDCFVKAIGREVIARMDKPLGAAERTLREAMHSSNA